MADGVLVGAAVVFVVACVCLGQFHQGETCSGRWSWLLVTGSTLATLCYCCNRMTKIRSTFCFHLGLWSCIHNEYIFQITKSLFLSL